MDIDPAPSGAISCNSACTILWHDKDITAGLRSRHPAMAKRPCYRFRTGAETSFGREGGSRGLAAGHLRTERFHSFRRIVVKLRRSIGSNQNACQQSGCDYSRAERSSSHCIALAKNRYRQGESAIKRTRRKHSIDHRKAQRQSKPRSYGSIQRVCSGALRSGGRFSLYDRRLCRIWKNKGKIRSTHAKARDARAVGHSLPQRNFRGSNRARFISASSLPPLYSRH